MKKDKLDILVVGSDIVAGAASRFVLEERTAGVLAISVDAPEPPAELVDVITIPRTPPDAMRPPWPAVPAPVEGPIFDWKTTGRKNRGKQARAYVRQTPFEKVPLAEIKVRTKPAKKKRDKKKQTARRAAMLTVPEALADLVERDVLRQTDADAFARAACICGLSQQDPECPIHGRSKTVRSGGMTSIF